jgi:predicted permease
MFIEAFKTTFGAILELVLLGAVGFFVVKRSIVRDEGVRVLSDLVIGLFLPCFMFSQIVERFSFSIYPDWWIFPLYSIFITLVGYACGAFVLAADKTLAKNAGEFLGITSFQNSGYLPLPLVAALLPAAAAQEMFILIFLFLLGFNMTIFSFGVMILAPKKEQRFDYRHMFNAPVVATLLALALVFFKINTILPQFVARPVDILGRCAIPLSILVVGGNLASLKTKGGTDIKPVSLSLLIKLVIMPLLFLGFVILVKPKPLVGLLILLQAAMPPAALLSVITKNHNQSGRLINQAIFYGHIASILTIPLFLAIYWALAGKSY